MRDVCLWAVRVVRRLMASVRRAIAAETRAPAASSDCASTCSGDVCVTPASSSGSNSSMTPGCSASTAAAEPKRCPAANEMPQVTLPLQASGQLVAALGQDASSATRTSAMLGAAAQEPLLPALPPAVQLDGNTSPPTQQQKQQSVRAGPSAGGASTRFHAPPPAATAVAAPRTYEIWELESCLDPYAMSMQLCGLYDRADMQLDDSICIKPGKCELYEASAVAGVPPGMRCCVKISPLVITPDVAQDEARVEAAVKHAMREPLSLLEQQDVDNVQRMLGWAIIPAPCGTPNSFEVVLATELCDGDLRKAVGKLLLARPSHALAALGQAVVGLSDMLRRHDSVHGDVKLDNVLVNKAAAAAGGPLAQVREGMARAVLLGEVGGGGVGDGMLQAPRSSRGKGDTCHAALRSPGGCTGGSLRA
jgi:hypothetical protein